MADATYYLSGGRLYDVQKGEIPLNITAGDLKLDVFVTYYDGVEVDLCFLQCESHWPQGKYTWMAATEEQIKLMKTHLLINNISISYEEEIAS